MTIGRILAVGARSPLGLDARQIAMAQRAQKLTPRRLTLPGSGGTSYGTARARCVADDVFGADRLVELATPALAECLATSPVPRLERAILHLAVPEARPTPDERVGKLLTAIAAGAGVDLDVRASTTIVGGHAGFAVALERALATSRSTGQPALAGAVDTYHQEETIRWLADEHRIHGPGVGDGFIPSEGAAFALVSADTRGPRLASVAAIELGADESDEESADPAIAVAMTRVVDRALEAAGGPVEWILTDVNGERHRTKEWSFVLVRLRHRIDPDQVQLDRPYQEAGDAGAATGALFTCLACMAWDTGLSARKRVMLALRAEGPPRAAIVLEAP